MDKAKRVLTILLIIIIPIIVGMLVLIIYKMGWFSTKSNAPLPETKEYTYLLGDFTVNLDDPGYKRYIKVKIYAGTDYKKLDVELTDKSPQICDLINNILRSKKMEDINTPVKTDGVKKEIKDNLNKVLTSGKISNVYFNEILIQ